LPSGDGAVASVAMLRPPGGLDVEIVEIDGEEFLLFAWDDSPIALPELTPAEQVIFQGIVNGQSNAEIAACRRTSVRTVANQVASLFAKLAVSSRAELVARFGHGHGVALRDGCPFRSSRCTPGG
jgi:DNA-binding CsgD family transcriptional regulator